MISLVDTLSKYKFQSANVILDKNPNKNQSLWLGDFTAAIDRRWQINNKIVAVLTVASGLGIRVADGVVHKVIDAFDEEDYDIFKDFDEGCDFIHTWLDKGPVLVHCAAGVSRSASMVICYLMRLQRWRFAKAYTFVKSKRRVVEPNSGFVQCLKKEEKRLGLTRAPEPSYKEIVNQKNMFPLTNYLQNKLSPDKYAILQLQNRSKNIGSNFILRSGTQTRIPIPKQLVNIKEKPNSAQQKETDIMLHWKVNEKIGQKTVLRGKTQHQSIQKEVNQTQNIQLRNGVNQTKNI